MAMSVYFLDSGDYGSGTGIGLTAKWHTVSGFGVTAVGTGRYGDGQSRCFTGTGFATRTINTTQYVVCHTAFKHNLAVASVINVLELGRAGTGRLALRYDAGAQKFSVRRLAGSAATLATGSYVASIGEWLHLEFLAKFDSSTGGEYHLFINGSTTADMSATGVQTIDSGAADNLCDQVTIRANLWDLDGIVVTGGTPATTLAAEQVGDSFIWSQAPTGDGNYGVWTPQGGGANYVEVDDISGTGYNIDGDSTYNETSTATDKDSFTYDNVDTTKVDTNNIYAVQLNDVARFTGSGPATLRQFLRRPVSGTPTDTFGTAQSLSSTYLNIMDIWETNPTSGTAWTAATIDDTEWGYELNS